jgi:hypothetical protein
MYHFFTTLSLWSAFYVATLAILFRLAQGAGLPSFLSTNTKYSLAVLIVTALVPRMAWLGLETLISLDALWYIDYGKFMAQGQMPYADFFFPYPPVFGYLIYFVFHIAPVVDSFRFLSIAFDFAIVIVLWAMSRSDAVAGPGVLLPLAYAMLPFSIVESGFNGHFEPLANLLILLGIWGLIKGQDQASAILIGLGAATKTYAIFLIPILILNIKDHRKKVKFIFIALITLYLTFIPFSILVWLRGDFLLPGAAMPGLSTGFLEATLGFIGRLGPTEFIAIIIVAFCVVLLMTVISARSVSLLRSFRTALLYDILIAGVAVFLGTMILLTWIYPFLEPGIGVYWRYPTDIALAKGASAAAGTLLMFSLAWRRWRTIPRRHVSNFQLSILAAFLLILLLSMSRDVFYGWYLLWAIPPLLALRDRRFLYLAMASMLFIYPSYTHDNFVSLGVDESKTWNDDFSTVEDWEVAVDLTRTNVTPSEVAAYSSSEDGIGAFTVYTAAVSNRTDLENVLVSWSKNVSIPVNQRTEFVVRVSATWDPTFGRACYMGLYYKGTDSTESPVEGPIIDPPYFAPTNLSFYLWRFSVYGQGHTPHPTHVNQLKLVVGEIHHQNLSILFDTIYATDVDIVTPEILLFAAFLTVPNMTSVLILGAVLPRESEWFEEPKDAE